MRKKINNFGVPINQKLLEIEDKRFLNIISIYLHCWGTDFYLIFYEGNSLIERKS